MSVLELIVKQYGYALMRSDCQKILNCGKQKLKALIDDGTLRLTADGSKIDVTSVAEYITGGIRKTDHDRRMSKKYPYKTV